MAQDSNTIIPGLTPAVRAWIYGIIIAAVPLLTAYGVLDDSKAAVWVAAAAAVLGLGTSAAHVKAAPEVVETAAVDEDALAERVADQVVASQAPTPQPAPEVTSDYAPAHAAPVNEEVAEVTVSSTPPDTTAEADEFPETVIAQPAA
ncbi:MAG: hypothetical protein L0I17_03900 [Actinomycetia bacterium]|nr:hypothetical protein [Actinomycetes bacterium]